MDDVFTDLWGSERSDLGVKEKFRKIRFGRKVTVTAKSLNFPSIHLLYVNSLIQSYTYINIITFTPLYIIYFAHK